MVTRDAFLAAIIATATFVNGLLLAQQPTRRPDGERPEPNAEPAEFLRWLDRNRNGTIDRNELVGQFGARIQALARTNQNIDLTRPVPIDKLVREFSHNQSRSGTTSPRFPSAEPLVPGFGVENDLPRVPGFGVEDDLPRVPGFGTAGDFFSVRVIDQDRRTVDERFRRYDSNRDGYLSREELARNRWSDDPLVYDRNRDGRLSKDEMAVRYARRRIDQEQGRRARQQEEASRLMRFYVALDTNGNKVLEPSEFANNRSRSTIERRIREAGMDPSRPVALSSFMSQRLRNAGIESDRVKRIVKSIEPPRSKGTPRRESDNRSRQRKNSRRIYRFKTAHERLPSGIPGWFRERDLNRDGQVAMSEYSLEWTDSRLAEFDELDLNGDGIITLKECLAALSKDTGASRR